MSRCPLCPTHLSVDLLSEGGAWLGGGVQGRAGAWLHGDELHLVGLATGAVRRGARKAVNMVKDGG